MKPYSSAATSGLVPVARGLATAALLAAGCVSVPAPVPWSGAPATYAGLFSCAACSGAHLTITLFPSGFAVFRRANPAASQGSDAGHAELGYWSLSGSRRVTVRHGDGTAWHFSLIEPGAIRMLSPEGREMVPPVIHDLGRQAEPLTDIVKMSGLYTIAGNDDAGSITECTSGKTLPVAARGQYIPLRADYLNRVKQAGEPVLLAFDGRLVMEIIIGTDRLREVFVVTNPGRLAPNTTCPPRAKP